MTLEEVIADCEEKISDCQIDLDGIANLLEEYPERKEAFAHEIDDYKKRMDNNRQLAEWLRELQERRKQPEIVRCKDCIKGKYHNLAKSTMCMLHPFNPVRVEPDGFCKWAERRTDENTV